MNRDQIQEQLNGKMYWDASESEVRDWLSAKHGIIEKEADEMIAIGTKAKQASIRKSSLIRMSVSLIAALPLGFFAWLAMQSSQRRAAGALGTLCLGCLGYAAKNFVQVLNGRCDTAIDA
ncbi:hypothetical protein [Prosthecobacter sp.]|uniref:hypothetical protein n=1 Tax=Prosthecobacter sp. TaxID=1965333 RepID=UPI003783829B